MATSYQSFSELVDGQLANPARVPSAGEETKAYFLDVLKQLVMAREPELTERIMCTLSKLRVDELKAMFGYEDVLRAKIEEVRRAEVKSSDRSTVSSEYKHLSTLSLLDLVSSVSTPVDITVTCKDESWPCHRALISARCPFFKACAFGQFAEATDGVIALPDQCPDAIEALLRHLYFFERAAKAPQNLNEIAVCTTPTNLFGIPLLMDIFVVADKYGVDVLKTHAKALLKVYLGREIKNVDADEEDDNDVGIALDRVLDKLCDPEVSMPEELQDLIIGIFASAPKQLQKSAYLQDQVMSRPVFASLLVKSLASSRQKLEQNVQMVQYAAETTAALNSVQKQTMSTLHMRYSFLR